MHWRAITLLLLATIWAMPATAAEKMVQFDTPGQEQRYYRLIDQLRCLVCQNQNIADSNADLARDLRRIVQNKIRRGESDRQILDYLVARYGDFVLYNPRLKPATWLLWFGPFVLLIIAVLILLRIIRHRQDTVVSLSNDDERRIEELLKRDHRS